MFIKSEQLMRFLTPALTTIVSASNGFFDRAASFIPALGRVNIPMYLPDHELLSYYSEQLLAHGGDKELFDLIQAVIRGDAYAHNRVPLDKQYENENAVLRALFTKDEYPLGFFQSQKRYVAESEEGVDFSNPTWVEPDGTYHRLVIEPMPFEQWLEKPQEGIVKFNDNYSKGTSIAIMIDRDFYWFPGFGYMVRETISPTQPWVRAGIHKWDIHPTDFHESINRVVEKCFGVSAQSVIDEVKDGSLPVAWERGDTELKRVYENCCNWQTPSNKLAFTETVLEDLKSRLPKGVMLINKISDYDPYISPYSPFGNSVPTELYPTIKDLLVLMRTPILLISETQIKIGRIEYSFINRDYEEDLHKPTVLKFDLGTRDFTFDPSPETRHLVKRVMDAMSIIYSTVSILPAQITEAPSDEVVEDLDFDDVDDEA